LGESDSVTSVIQLYYNSDAVLSTGDIDETTVANVVKGYKGLITKDQPGSSEKCGDTGVSDVACIIQTPFVIVFDRVELKNPIESQQTFNMKDILVGESIEMSIQIETNQTTHYSLMYKPTTSSTFKSAITIPEQDFKNKTINGQNTELYVVRYIN
jgi:hypothetical protein